MQTDFSGHLVYLFFQTSPQYGGLACQVVGPYRSVRISAKGIWAYGDPGTEPLRVATQAINSDCWELDGFEDQLWGEVKVIAPNRPTSAREIEAANGWVIPQ